MKAVGLYGQVKPPSGPVEAELVLWEKAKEWALAKYIEREGNAKPPRACIEDGYNLGQWVGSQAAFTTRKESHASKLLFLMDGSGVLAHKRSSS